MSSMAMQRGAGSGYVQRGGGGLYEIIDVLLDKGLVIDVFLRVSLVGIELLTVDARIVLASVDTYLRFAEAVNRLDLLQSSNEEGIPQLIGDMTEGGSENKTRGILEGAKDSIFGSSGGDEDEDSSGSEGDDDSSSSRRSSSSARSSSSSRGGSRSRSSASRGRSNS